MHAPGHIRDAFCELVEEGEATVEFYGKHAHVDAMSADERLWWLSGQLWNCTDVLPGGVCGGSRALPGLDLCPGRAAYPPTVGGIWAGVLALLGHRLFNILNRTFSGT